MLVVRYQITVTYLSYERNIYNWVVVVQNIRNQVKAFQKRQWKAMSIGIDQCHVKYPVMKKYGSYSPTTSGESILPDLHKREAWT